MNKFKKTVCIILTAVFIFSLVLSGCSSKKLKEGQEKGATVQSSSGTTEQTEQKSELKPVTLTWYFPGPFPLPDQDMVFAECNKIIQPKINATVDFKAINWGDYDNKISVIMASNEPFDLCFTANWAANYVTSVGKGAFLPLDDLLKNYAPKLFASIPEKIWSATRVNGKIYGIINNQIMARSIALGFTKEVIDKFGFDPDSVGNDLDKIEPLLEKIKQNRPDLIPFTMFGLEEFAEAMSQEWIVGAGTPGAVYLTDNSAKVVNQFKTPEYVKYIERMRKWGQKGYLGGEQLVSAGDLNAPIAEGKIPVAVGGTWKPGVDAETSMTYKRPFIVRPVSDKYLTTNGVTATMHAISRNSQNPERAMMFMELMNTDVKLYNTMTFGIEGKHYKKTQGNYIELVKDSGFIDGNPWRNASTFNAYLLEGQPEDVWEQTKKLNLEAKASPIIGFSFNSEPVKSEIAQCNSVYQEFRAGFNFGLLDTKKDYQTFLDKLDKAGAQKIIDEIQRQIDEWKKAQ